MNPELQVALLLFVRKCYVKKQKKPMQMHRPLLLAIPIYIEKAIHK